MEIVQTRRIFTEKSTISEVAVNGASRLLFLEDRFRRPGELKVPGETAIPCGYYKVTFEKSPHFSALAGHEVKTPRVNGVPGFEGILIHPGNKPADTKGCPVTGMERGIDEVFHSVDAYAPLARDIEAAVARGEDVHLLVQLAPEAERDDPKGLTKGLDVRGMLLKVTGTIAGLAVMLLSLPAFAQEPGPSPTAADGSVGSKVLNAFLQYALPPIVTAIAGLVVYALKKLGDFLHAKADGSKVGQALVVGTDFIGAAVAHVVAGLAPDVRAALADDGVISEAERTALKTKALALIKAELPEGIKAVLGGVMQGGLDTYLSGLTEKALTLATGQAGKAPEPAPAGP